jgi:hypothetical protein
MIVQTTTTPTMSSRNVVEEDVDDENISSIDDVSSIDDLDGAPGKREHFIATCSFGVLPIHHWPHRNNVTSARGVHSPAAQFYSPYAVTLVFACTLFQFDSE